MLSECLTAVAIEAGQVNRRSRAAHESLVVAIDHRGIEWRQILSIRYGESLYYQPRQDIFETRAG
jgi:hypothetical protein